MLMTMRVLAVAVAGTALLASCGGREYAGVGTDHGGSLLGDDAGEGAAGAEGSVGSGGTAGSGGSAGSGGGVPDATVDARGGGTDSGGLADATGVLPPLCDTCLGTSCASSYATCLADPDCRRVIECWKSCVAGGMGSTACALTCAADAAASAGGQAIELFVCAKDNCPGSCSG